MKKGKLRIVGRVGKRIYSAYLKKSVPDVAIHVIRKDGRKPDIEQPEKKREREDDAHVDVTTPPQQSDGTTGKNIRCDESAPCRRPDCEQGRGGEADYEKCENEFGCSRQAVRRRRGDASVEFSAHERSSEPTFRLSQIERHRPSPS